MHLPIYLGIPTLGEKRFIHSCAWSPDVRWKGTEQNFDAWMRPSERLITAPYTDLPSVDVQAAKDIKLSEDGSK